MPYQAVPNGIELLIRGTNLEMQTENSFYFQKDGTVSQLDLDNLTDGVSAAVITYWKPNLPSSWVGVEVYARGLSAAVDLQSTDTSIAGEVGTLSGTPMPSLATVAVARRSGLTGRASRGRIFWQALSESFTTGNQITSGMATSILEAVNAVDTVAIGLDLLPIIVSRLSEGATPTEALVFAIADWLFTDLVIDTRRSRKPGSGS